ncbi:MAG: helix-turn-helix domain-containing protein [Syntrophaceae bacterium]|nr:helix-turn-helix domain-containing protein [Syntrophaceae bacterium]
MKELMTVRKVSQSLSVSTATVRRWIKDGKLTALRLNQRTIRIPSEAIEKFVWIQKQFSHKDG